MTSRKRRSAKNKSSVYGVLESRKLMASVTGQSGAMIEDLGSQIVVTGTDLADNVSVQALNNTTTRVKVSNQTETIRYDFQTTNQTIEVDLKAGDDLFANFDTDLVNVVFGGEGNDYIRGGEGHDELRGGPGNDTIEGRLGRDLIHGGQGADVIDGGMYRDTIYGGGGNGSDFVLGGSGDDVIRGGYGGDRLGGHNYSPFWDSSELFSFGIPEFDNTAGQRGYDRIYGDGGNDVLTGFDGDKLVGGASDDTFVVYGTVEVNGMGSGSLQSYDIVRLTSFFQPTTGFKNIDRVIRPAEGSPSPNPQPGPGLPGSGLPGPGLPDPGLPGPGQPGHGQPGHGQPGHGQTGKAEMVVSGVDGQQNATAGFVQRNDNVSKSFTITNTGNADLQISRVDVASGFSIVNALPNSIAPGDSATLQINIPTGQTGVVDGYFRISSNSYGGSITEIGVSATVINRVSFNGGGTLQSYKLIESGQGLMVLKTVRMYGASGNNTKLFADFHNNQGAQTHSNKSVGNHDVFGNQSRLPRKASSSRFGRHTGKR